MNRCKDSTAPILAIVFISICGLLFYHLFYESIECYAVIDNTSVTKISQGYKYSLKSYDQKGRIRNISLNINHQLPTGHILKLKISNTKVVHSWKQITFDQIPDDIKIIYKNYESSFLE